MKNHTAQDIALSVLSEPHMPLPNYIFSLLPEEHLFPDSPVPCIYVNLITYYYNISIPKQYII